MEDPDEPMGVSPPSTPTRRLIVMRHAKSDWNSGAASDHDRPLNARGQRDAPRIARKIVELGWSPQVVVSSDACRTRETFQRMEPELVEPPTVLFLESLYLAGFDSLAHVLADVPDEYHTVLALGHNPGWEDVVQTLSGEPTKMTTANAALLTIQAANWPAAAVREYAWDLVDVLRPKELDD